MLALVLKHKVFDSGLVLSQAECIRDHTFILSEWHNNLMYDKQLRDYILCVCAWLIDAITIYSVFRWYLNHNSIRVYIALILVYGVRGQLLDLFFLSKPQGWLWLDPGWPSLMISYFDCADFYYSGHMSLLVVILIELRATGSVNA